MTTAWHDVRHQPITWEMFLEIDEDIRRDLEIVDGYVVPCEQRSREHQKVATRLSLRWRRQQSSRCANRPATQ